MASILGLLNRLLPFATPGTPLLQDIVHLGAICTLLYFAPQIQQWIQTGSGSQWRSDDQHNDTETQAAGVPQDQPPERFQNIPEAENDEPDESAPANAPEDAPDLHDFQAPQFGVPREGEPGPANPVASLNQRNVGAKKAKALARKDQKRAYNEFMRSQGDAQRAKDAEGAAEREAAIAAERARRKAAEAALEAKKAKEREQKREAEKREREAEYQRRDLVIRLVREALEENRMCDLFKVARQVGEDADEEWVEKILNASNLLGMKNGVLTMVTSVGWAVRLSQEDVGRMYQKAIDEQAEDTDDGSISYEALGGILEGVLKEETAAPG